MSIRRGSSRWFASLAVLLALLALGAFVAPVGCGGSSGGSSKKGKKKGGKKGDKKGDEEKGGGEGGGGASDTDIEIELVKDQFKGVLNEYMQGNTGLAELEVAVENAQKKIEELPAGDWVEEFKTAPWGLNNAIVELCKQKWLPVAVQWAESHPENIEEGKAKIREVAARLEDIPRDRLAKTKHLDYQATYDEVMAKIDKSLKSVETLGEMVRRTPPSMPVNLVDREGKNWIEEGPVEATFSAGRLMLEGKGAGARITATHYYLKDFDLRVTFTIQRGGLDFLLRVLPGKNSVFNGGFSKDQLPDPEAPFTMIMQVRGNKVNFLDTEGRDLYGEPIVSDRAPAGGGIGIQLRGRDSSVIIQEMIVEAK